MMGPDKTVWMIEEMSARLLQAISLMIFVGYFWVWEWIDRFFIFLIIIYEWLLVLESWQFGLSLAW